MECSWIGPARAGHDTARRGHGLAKGFRVLAGLNFLSRPITRWAGPGLSGRESKLGPARILDTLSHMYMCVTTT